MSSISIYDWNFACVTRKLNNIYATITVSGFTDINFAKITGKPNTTPIITLSGDGTTKQVSVNAQG